MKCIVSKKFYDPFLKRTVKAGEGIDIPDDLVDNYSQYVQFEEPVYTKIKEPEVEVLGEVGEIEKPKKKRR